MESIEDINRPTILTSMRDSIRNGPTYWLNENVEIDLTFTKPTIVMFSPGSAGDVVPYV